DLWEFGGRSKVAGCIGILACAAKANPPGQAARVRREGAPAEDSQKDGPASRGGAVQKLRKGGRNAVVTSHAGHRINSIPHLDPPPRVATTYPPLDRRHTGRSFVRRLLRWDPRPRPLAVSSRR